MTMLGQFCAFHGTLKFSMIGLDQEDETEEITLWPDIWWHDAVYHKADHCMNWPQSAYVHIFWSRPAEGAVVLWTSFFFNWCHICVLHHNSHFQIHIHTDWFDGYHFWHKNATVAVIKMYSCTVNNGHWINDGIIPQTPVSGSCCLPLWSLQLVWATWCKI